LKNVKYIAVILVVALGLIGGAYAWWTDTLEIEATADTAELKMEFVSVALWGAGPQGTDPYMTGTHTNHPRKPVFTIENMYPEAKASLALFAQNKGDIPVKLSDVKVTLSAEDERIWDYVKAKVNARYLENGKTWPVEIGSEEGYLYYLSDLVKDAVGSQVINPGDQIRLGREATEDDPDPTGSITIWLDKDTPNEFQDVSFSFDVEMIWEQWNAQ
jgi:predicted ribosomally synthesized peptide with SipW-like signal peptide